MNDRQDTIEDLFNRLGEQEKQNVINYAYLYDDKRGLRSEIRQLQSNWNSLREWLGKQIQDSKYCFEWNKKNNFNDIDYERDIARFEFVLDKMNELEGGEDE